MSCDGTWCTRLATGRVAMDVFFPLLVLQGQPGVCCDVNRLWRMLISEAMTMLSKLRRPTLSTLMCKSHIRTNPLYSSTFFEQLRDSNDSAVSQRVLLTHTHFLPGLDWLELRLPRARSPLFESNNGTAGQREHAPRITPTRTRCPSAPSSQQQSRGWWWWRR